MSIADAYNGAGVSRNLACRFDASAGTGTIPSDALMALHDAAGTFSMANITHESVDVGDWHVDLDAYWNAVWPDDTLASGQTKVQ